jgi:hypothetical protein
MAIVNNPSSALYLGGQIGPRGSGAFKGGKIDLSTRKWEIIERQERESIG